MTALLPLSVILPLLGAGLALSFRRQPNATRAISVTTLAGQLGVECAMVIDVDASGPMVMHVGGWVAPVGITMVADRFAAILMVVSTVVTLAVLIYSIAQQRGGPRRDGPAVAFHPAMLMMAAGVSNAFVAGDLFNLFVSFELLLTASYVLLTLGGTPERLRAGAPYLVVSLLSSVIFLSAIALVYAATGTVNLADLAGKLAGLPPGVVAVLQALLLLAFGIKAAVWPMSAWLPDSYPNAPSPVAAVFAGLLTKVGIYAIIRTQTLLFGARGFTTLLMYAALATLLVGVLGAIAQADIKRMLSFTLVSHIGYMLFGVALGSLAGLTATVYYVLHHILVQTGLFLAAGLIEHLRGTTVVARLGGLARASPMLALVFFVPAMSLAGVPPLPGFLGKVGLFQAGLGDGRVLPVVVVAGGTVTSLLTLYAIVRIWGRAFWRPTPQPQAAAAGPSPVLGDAVGRAREVIRPVTGAPAGPAVFGAEHAVSPAGQTASGAGVGTAGPQTSAPATGGSPAIGVADAAPNPAAAGPVRRRMPLGMLGATAAVVLSGVMLTVAAGPVYDFAGRVAGDLAHPASYVTAVLGRP